MCFKNLERRWEKIKVVVDKRKASSKCVLQSLATTEAEEKTQSTRDADAVAAPWVRGQQGLQQGAPFLKDNPRPAPSRKSRIRTNNNNYKHVTERAMNTHGFPQASRAGKAELGWWKVTDYGLCRRCLTTPAVKAARGACAAPLPSGLRTRSWLFVGAPRSAGPSSPW